MSDDEVMLLAGLRTALAANPALLSSVLEVTFEGMSEAVDRHRRREEAAREALLATFALRDRRGMSEDLQARMNEIILAAVTPGGLPRLSPLEKKAFSEAVREMEVNHAGT